MKHTESVKTEVGSVQRWRQVLPSLFSFLTESWFNHLKFSSRFVLRVLVSHESFANVDKKTRYIDTLHYNFMTAFGKQIENKFTFSQRFMSSQVLFFSPKFKDIQSIMGTGNRTAHQFAVQLHCDVKPHASLHFMGFSLITVEKIVKCSRKVPVQLKNYLFWPIAKPKNQIIIN